MPISNIIDNRSNSHQTNCQAIFEDSWHDHHLNNIIPKVKDVIQYLSIASVEIKSAIAYINQEYPDDDITMYLYDEQSNHYDHTTINKVDNHYILSRIDK